MIAAAAILSIIALVAIVYIAIALRRIVEDEKRTESQLHDPHTPTVTRRMFPTVVPNGGASMPRKRGPIPHLWPVSRMPRAGLRGLAAPLTSPPRRRRSRARPGAPTECRPGGFP